MAELRMKVAGRELRFAFDLQAWFDVEAVFGSLSEMNRRLEENERPMEVSMELAAITATAGDRESEPVTVDWLREHLTPKQASKAAMLAKTAFVEGMTRDEDEPEGATDVVLEELEKKRTPKPESNQISGLRADGGAQSGGGAHYPAVGDHGAIFAAAGL